MKVCHGIAQMSMCHEILWCRKQQQYFLAVKHAQVIHSANGTLLKSRTVFLALENMTCQNGHELLHF